MNHSDADRQESASNPAIPQAYRLSKKPSVVHPSVGKDMTSQHKDALPQAIAYPLR